MLKRTFKVTAIAIILGLSTAFAGGTLAPTPIATFEVGFDFRIGNKTFSKGKYKLSKSGQYVLILENLKAGERKIIFGNPSSKKRTEKVANVLSFNRYGNQYFLREVKSSELSARVKLSKQEKLAKKQLSHKKVMVRGGK